MRDDLFLIELGAKIKAYRLRRRMRIIDLAKEIGVKAATVAEIEKGRRNFHICTLRTLSQVLKIKLKDFF